ncbi:TolC family outer membrane protein [Pseudodesulfovibrio sp.]|uniref:TolC family outer membrane protein n=1 Tax=Pseudodesulfovibrio sp. TaxID=2035812 RepID=UPI002604262E|nr:TolC family outer membrane protein [Pseudodesulfovibrio sp.]MDD3311181.1 TolC family outer membrane protein [Pseudodesulfovibrio sp.]
MAAKRHLSTLPALLALFVLLLSGQALAGTDGNTTLIESVKKAVGHHSQIKAMTFNREAVSRDLASALGRFFPSLDLTSDYGFQKYNTSSARALGNEDRTRTASDSKATLTQNLFDGMYRISDYYGSKARLTSAEYRLLDNVETVALDAIRAHVDVVRLRKLVTLAEENVTSHQEVLESIAERVAGGAGSMADEMQARGRVARAETTLITYKGDLSSAEAQYFRVVGNEPGPLEAIGFHEEMVPKERTPYMDVVLRENPKVKVYQAEVEAKREDKGMTGASMMPNVDVQVSSRYTDHLDGASTYLRDDRAMLALSWNLFNGTSDFQDIKAAQARVDQAKADLQDTMDELGREASTTWTDYQTALGQVGKHQEALQYSMESRDMYLMQFNVGQRSLLDVLDAINEVFSNSVQLETALSNRDFTIYKFLALEGNLVKTLDIAEAATEGQASEK